MNDKQLTPGDLALVIKSVTGKAMGKIVECIQILGTDPKLGVIWLVKSPNLIEAYHDGAKSNQSHMPQDWLRKIPKDPLPDDEDVIERPKVDELEKA